MKKKFFLAIAMSVTFLFTACQKNSVSTDTENNFEESLKVTGGSVKRLYGNDAGISLDNTHNTYAISSDEWKRMEEIPETGLFVVDSDHLPFNFYEEIAKMGISQQRNGSLVNQEGSPMSIFVYSETFEVIPDGPKKRSNPPFKKHTYTVYWVYKSGFCRSYRAYTMAYAWGLSSTGEKLPTKIDYIYTNAKAGSVTDRDYCYNCHSESSVAVLDFGCWWPAHGKASGSFYAYWRDGSKRIEKRFVWEH